MLPLLLFFGKSPRRAGSVGKVKIGYIIAYFPLLNFGGKRDSTMLMDLDAGA